MALFALAVGLALLANSHQGYVLVVVPPRRILISLNFFIILGLGALGLLYVLLRAFAGVVALPGRVARFRWARRQAKAESALRDAVGALFSGRYAESIKKAQYAFDKGEGGQEIAALVAARAASALRDETRYSIWMTRASQGQARMSEARLMTEAQLAVEAMNFDIARERLETLRVMGHRSIASQRLALKVASVQQEWDEVLRLARQLYKHKALSHEQVAPILRHAHLERLKESAQDGNALEGRWRSIPSAEQEDRLLVQKAIPILVGAQRSMLARKMLEKALSLEWDSELARLYGQCGQQDPVVSLGRAEAWYAQHPNDVNLLYALGQLCIAAQLWGKAETYFERALSLAESLETHLALARLFEQTDREEEAQIHYRAAAGFL